ncbi:MAG: hypothetical protein ABSA47_13370 [Verrucomicrobiota bacterium]
MLKPTAIPQAKDYCSCRHLYHLLSQNTGGLANQELRRPRAGVAKFSQTVANRSPAANLQSNVAKTPRRKEEFND